jgi:hypothetical protein
MKMLARSSIIDKIKADKNSLNETITTRFEDISSDENFLENIELAFQIVRYNNNEVQPDETYLAPYQHLFL